MLIVLIIMVFFVQLLLYVFCIPTEGEVSKMSNF